MRFQPENFPGLTIRLSMLHLLTRPMHCHCRQDEPVSQLIVPKGPLIGWCSVHTSRQWSGLGLRRMHRLLIKKLPRHSLTTKGPSTRGTLSSRTCTIFTLIAFVYRRWLVRRNTPSPSPSARIRGPTSVW